MAIGTSATVSGSGTAVSSIALTSWSPSANDLILVWVACRSGVTATGVSGNGITFSQVLSDTESPQNQCTLSLWRGMSASPTTGQITVTLSGTANAAIAVAHRISGADTSGSNGSGAIGASAIANTGATDTNAPSVNLTTTAADSRVYGGATHRTQVYSVGTGETAISLNNTVGAAGDTTSLSTEYQDVATASSVTINGTLPSATDWIQGAVEVKAAATLVDKAGTESGTLTDTSAATMSGAATDSGTGSDVSALAATRSSTDSATFSDTSALAAARSSTDSATLSDAASVADLGTVRDGTEAGAFTDAAALSTSAVATDTAVLSDTASLSAQYGATDSAAFTDTAAIGVTSTDTASLSDTSALAVALNRTDTGTLSDVAVLSATIVLHPWPRHIFSVPAADYSAITRLDTRLTVPADTYAAATRLDTYLTVAASDLASEA